MLKEYKTPLIIVAAIAALLAVYSGWRTLGGSSRSAEQRKTTAVGPISHMSSMLGPDASGKPRTGFSGGPPTSGANRTGPPMGMNNMMGPGGSRMGGQMPRGAMSGQPQ